jgi:hypothetical protein
MKSREEHEHSVLNSFDFAAIEEMDPSLGTIINRFPLIKFS